MHPALPIVGKWLLKNIVPVAIVLTLAFSHWWAYDSGQEDIEKKYEAQRQALIEENARLAAYNEVLNEKLATRQTKAQIDRAGEKTKALVEANEYVRNNPHDPSCYVTDSDIDFLR